MILPVCPGQWMTGRKVRAFVYNVQVTDEALSRVAQVITERDVEIALLRQQLAELRAATGRPSLETTSRSP